MKQRYLLLTLCLLFSACNAHSALVINEVCYDNSKVEDETGDDTSDWIELYNSGPGDVNINGYGVGDANPYKETKGVRLPNYSIPAGGFLLVFANSDLAEYTTWTNAPDYAVIPENSNWKFRHESSAPTGSWTLPAYADSSWQEGISPLGHNTSVASMDCATILGDPSIPSTLHQTAYFRQKFDVLKPSVVTGLVMRARIKDGMVVYLNGTEILRRNMPAGTISYATLASSAVSSTSWTETTLSAAALVTGENTLTIEVHKASPTGTAIIMDMSMTALINELVPIVHGQFGLKKAGEKVHLFNASLTRIDICESPGYEIGANNSWGTITDGNTSTFKVYDKTTPTLPNSTYNQKYEETLTSQTPVFSVAPGFYATSQNVILSSPGYRIFYTLDGSDPWDSTTFVWSGTSPISIGEPADITNGIAWNRTNPVETGANVPGAAWLSPIGSIDKAVILRAITVSGDGTKCSPEMQGTYFIGAEYSSRSLPVFSLITENDSLYGFVSGLYLPGKNYADSPEGYGSNKWGKPYANYHQENNKQEWERPVHMELFETNQNSSVISMNMGVAMHGGGSRAIPQKTLYMIARNGEYGTKFIDYQLFPELPAVQYKRFLLRNSGNDWYGAASAGNTTMMRDSVFHEICSSLDISVMATRPALVYINGEYWGIHNLRESFDKHYLATRYNIDPDNADILTHVKDSGSTIKIARIDGDTAADNEYEAMLDWIQLNPLNINANYQQLTTQMDVDNYADYIIAETFFANTDWPQNNCDFWRANSNQVDVAGEYGDQRWRWMLYDLDVAGEDGAAFNMFTYLTDNSMTAVDEPAFLINQLWLNMTFRNSFASRYADLLNTSFRPSHTAGAVSAAEQKIQSEIETHFRRWGRNTTESQWENGVTTYLSNYLADRHNISWAHLNSHFSLGGTGQITVKNQDAAGTGGYLKVNTVEIKSSTDGVDDPANWTGTYFQSLPVTVEAIASPGYVFDGWVGTTVSTAERTVFAGTSPKTFIARFRTAGDPPHITDDYEAWQINNYNEQAIVEGTAAAPESPSGEAGLSNFELYAFGMNISDGLSDAQRLARASLSINAESAGLFAGFNRLNDSYNDVDYRLKAADSLSTPVLWRDAVPGEDYLLEALTNILDGATWFYQQKLNNSAAGKERLFFKLEVEQR